MRASDLLDEIEVLRRIDLQRYSDSLGIGTLTFFAFLMFGLRWQQCLIFTGIVTFLRLSRSREVARVAAQPTINTLRDLLQHEDYREALKPLCYKHRVVRNLSRDYLGIDFIKKKGK